MAITTIAESHGLCSRDTSLLTSRSRRATAKPEYVLSEKSCGVDTYKNYLPHYYEGGASEEGNPFSIDNGHVYLEGPLVGFLNQNISKSPSLARVLGLAILWGKGIRWYASSDQNWKLVSRRYHWRMIFDLNKVLLYTNPEGIFWKNNFATAKRYIGIVDAVLAGEGHDSLTHEPVSMGYIFIARPTRWL